MLNSSSAGIFVSCIGGPKAKLIIDAMGEEGIENVKGGKEIAALAEKGMALFAAQETEQVELDVEAATAFKAETEAKHAALEAEAAALTGKDNKKARSEKGKEAAALKNSPEYVDACRVVKGQPPKNGNFAKVQAAETKAEAAPAAVEEKPDEDEKTDKKKEKEDKKPKKQESAGISKAERDELEKLKNDIIARKKELKETGMSGGQINKDEQVSAWVLRMNELKEKENPGALQAQKDEKKGDKKKKLSADQEKDKKALEDQIEEYRNKLKTEFGYTNKDIKTDPDLNDMLTRLNAMK